MNNSLFLKLIVALVFTVYNYHLPAECVYCYVCNANNLACADPADLNAIRYNMEPCNGQCVVYVNQWTGVLTRSCSTYIGISGTGVQIINGVTYSFCTTDGCNAGGAPTLDTTIAATIIAGATTAAPTIAGATTAAPTAAPTTAAPTTAAPTTIGTTISPKCPGVICYSASTLNEATCTCNCLSAATYGTNCQYIDCSVQDPQFCSYVTCSASPTIPFQCTHLCGLCVGGVQTTAAPPTTAQTTVQTTVQTTAAPTTIVQTTKSGPCVPINCRYGGIFDLKTCTCKCPDNFIGTDCSTVSIAPDWTDPVQCNDPTLSCGIGLTLDEDVAGMCPLKCLFCGRKVCLNGGLLKTDCTCQCLAAYNSDPTCSRKNCVDSIACGPGKQFPPISCIYTEVISQCPTMCKAAGC